MTARLPHEGHAARTEHAGNKRDRATAVWLHGTHGTPQRRDGSP